MDYIMSFFVDNTAAEEIVEEENKDEKRQRGHISSMTLAMLFAILILSTLILGIIIIASVFYFIPVEGNGKNEKETFSDGVRRKRGSEIKIMTERLNFTAADDFCYLHVTGGSLIFPRGYNDEMKLLDFLYEQVDKSRDTINALCGDRLFIGVIHSMDKLWLLPNGEHANLPITFSRNASQKCALVNIEKEKAILQATSCEGKHWNCVICEKKCKNGSMCFEALEGTSASSHDDAAKFCRTLKNQQMLVSIPTVKVLRDIHHQVFSHIQECKQFGIGNMFNFAYESVAGEPMSYQAIGLAKLTRISQGKNCVGINHKKLFRWEMMDCSREHCFICRDENVPRK